MTTDITKRVARGVKWLDRHAPGWEERIKLREFNIRDECRCVLGQVFGPYFSILKDPLNPTGVISFRRAVTCGFDILQGLDPVDLVDAYDQLQREWKRVIRERKGGKK